jgi:ribA/ribD-fused uncharacterized protein
MERMVDGKTFLYHSLEQAFQHRKARMLKDQRTATLIMESTNPGKAKYLGDALNAHPNIAEWHKLEMVIMKELIQEKNRVSKAFREKLKFTDCAHIYHSVDDQKWGIGLHTSDVCHPINPASIRGLNMTGVLLMEVRNPPMSRENTCNRDPVKTNVNNSQYIIPKSTASVIKSSKERQERKPKARLIGNSLFQGIDEKRLSHLVDVNKTIVYTIQEAAQMKPTQLESDLIVLQLTTNDLKVKSPAQVIDDMKCLVNKIHHSLPSCKIALSLAPLQRTHGNMNQKIKVVNASLELFYKNSSVVNSYSNDNIDASHDSLTGDGVHLSRRGNSLLAGNLRSIISQNLITQDHNVNSRSNRWTQSNNYHSRYHY